MSHDNHNTESHLEDGCIYDFRYYNTLTREERWRLKLRPENNFRTADDNYSYWVKICDDGNILLYRSPIIAQIIPAKPSSSQQHVVLSRHDIELFRQIARDTPLEEISGLVKQLEALRSKQEGMQQDNYEYSYGDI